MYLHAPSSICLILFYCFASLFHFLTDFTACTYFHSCSLSVMIFFFLGGKFVCFPPFYSLKIDAVCPHKTDTETDRRRGSERRVREGGKERVREGDGGEVTDSTETAADSNQSHEGTLQPMWLIHKTRTILINPAPFSRIVNHRCTHALHWGGC